MQVPAADALLARIQALEAGSILFERLDDRAGVYLVGGAVRDLLLGLEPPDLDLVVEDDPGSLVERLGGEPRRHDRFATAAVVSGGHRFDIARARRETYDAPGALPDVEPAGLDEDLTRRDFAVNALAVELGGPRGGELRAVDGAVADLEARQLRVLHDRSFIDDPTRLLRLARYGARLGFEVEPDTLALAREAAAGGALATVTGPRLGNELRLLAREPDPVAALMALDPLGVSGRIDSGFGLRDEDLARRASELLPVDGRPDLLAIALALRGVPADRRRAVVERLAFEADDRDVIIAAASEADALARALEAAPSPSAIAAAVGGSGPELVALAGAEGATRAASAWLERLRHVKLEIDGGDLLAAGVPQGPSIGRGLGAALAAKLDGRASGREAELAEALAAARRP